MTKNELRTDIHGDLPVVSPDPDEEDLREQVAVLRVAKKNEKARLWEDAGLGMRARVIAL